MLATVDHRRSCRSPQRPTRVDDLRRVDQAPGLGKAARVAADVIATLANKAQVPARLGAGNVAAVAVLRREEGGERRVSNSGAGERRVSNSGAGEGRVSNSGAAPISERRSRARRPPTSDAQNHGSGAPTHMVTAAHALVRELRLALRHASGKAAVVVHALVVNVGGAGAARRARNLARDVEVRLGDA